MQQEREQNLAGMRGYTAGGGPTGGFFLNGEFVARDSARVSVFDHGYLYGDGIFEGIRAYNGRVFRLDEHLDRLYESARTIMLQIPLAKVQMREAVLETLRRNGLRDGYSRP